MADNPNQNRPGLGPTGERGGSSSGDLGLGHHGPASSRASVPPSEPRSSRASFDALDAQVDRPARLQMIVALILGLVLVAIPLYLWRRPRAESITVSSGVSDGGALPAVTAATSNDDKIAIGDPKNLSCHDPGVKKTLPEQCDHVVELEKLFAKAIEENASCVSKADSGGGTIIYIADVHFKKRTLSLSTPKEGRTLKSSKVAGACEHAVKTKLSTTLSYDTPKHDHTRYRVSITATYPGAVKP